MWKLMKYDVNFDNWELFDSGSYDYCQEVKIKYLLKMERYARRLRIKNFTLRFKIVKD